MGQKHRKQQLVTICQLFQTFGISHFGVSLKRLYRQFSILESNYNIYLAVLSLEFIT